MNSMKLNCAISVIITLCCSPAALPDESSEGLRLILDADYKVVKLADTVTLVLEIKGKGVCDIVSSTGDTVPLPRDDGIMFGRGFFSPLCLQEEDPLPSTEAAVKERVRSGKTVSKRKVKIIKKGKPDIGTSKTGLPDSFVYRFAVKPSKAGKLVLGPYELEFQGKKLLSNPVEITVYRIPGDIDYAFIGLSETEGKVGEPFKLRIEHNLDSVEDVMLKSSDTYKIKSKSSYTSFESKDGKMKNVYWKEYEITPLKKGVLRFDKKSLMGLGEDVCVPAITVNVQ